MLSKLTLEQKIELLGGINNMYTRPMPAIDLPRFKMSDASVGVRTWGPTTAYAGGVARRQLGHRSGAQDRRSPRPRRPRPQRQLPARSRRQHRSLADPGRNFEYLSEDPYLNSAMVVPFIEGVQSQGVIATVKHYALNDQEFNRHNASADVDERTMREIYLPAFEAAVTKAHVDAVMNSYNLVNGVHATQNDFLNLQVLKGEWGFQGVLMSDWDATYDGVAACNNGLDLEMPSPKFMNAKNLVPAVQAGQVKESTIDEHVLRLLRAELRYGFTTRPQFDPADSTYSLADRAARARGSSREHHAAQEPGKYPAARSRKIKNIAIIGPNAYPAVTGGGGSSEAQAFEPVSILTGIASLLGPDVHVFYSAGMPTQTTKRRPWRKPTWSSSLSASPPPPKREGNDRTFTLPAGQDALVEQVVAANPHTIVAAHRWRRHGREPLARQSAGRAPPLLSRPGGRHSRRANSLRPAQSRGQTPRLLRSQLGRKPLGEVVPRRSRGQHHAPHHRRERQAARLHHRAHQVWRQAHGRLSLLDHHRQASAVSFRLRPQLHHFQILEA